MEGKSSTHFWGESAADGRFRRFEARCAGANRPLELSRFGLKEARKNLHWLSYPNDLAGKGPVIQRRISQAIHCLPFSLSWLQYCALFIFAVGHHPQSWDPMQFQI